MEENKELLGRISRQLSQIGPLPNLPIGNDGPTSPDFVREPWSSQSNVSQVNNGQSSFQNLYGWNPLDLPDPSSMPPQRVQHFGPLEASPAPTFGRYGPSYTQGMWAEDNQYIPRPDAGSEALPGRSRLGAHHFGGYEAGSRPGYHDISGSARVYQNSLYGSDAQSMSHCQPLSVNDTMATQHVCSQVQRNVSSMFSPSFRHGLSHANEVPSSGGGSEELSGNKFSHEAHMHAAPVYDPRTPPPTFHAQHPESFASASLLSSHAGNREIFTQSQRSKPTLELDLGTTIDSRSGEQRDMYGVNEEEGREIYKAALEQWQAQKSNDVTLPKAENKSPPQSKKELHVTETSAFDKMKPSYSEIAKTPRSAPPTVTTKAETQNQEINSKTSGPKPQKRDLKTQKPPVRRTASGSKFMTRGLSSDSIKGSRYGLDSFGEPTTLSSSSESLTPTQPNTHSRRSSGSSVGSSVNALDEITLASSGRSFVTESGPAVKAHKEQGKSQPPGVPHTEKVLSPSDTAPGSKPPVAEKERLFFDPKRIFQTRSSTSKGQASAQSKSGTKPAEMHGSGCGNILLNNGKPTASNSSSKLAGNAKQHDYINNDLRDSSKLTNKAAEEGAHINGSGSAGKMSAPCDKYDKDYRSGKRSGNRQTNGAFKKEKLKQGDGGQRLSEAENGPHHEQDRPSLLFENLNTGKLEEWFAIVWEKLTQWGNVALVWLSNLLIYTLGLIFFIVTGTVHLVLVILNKSWAFLKVKLLKDRAAGGGTWSRREQARKRVGLEENIVLPSTGDEAMKRLLACKGKDPYSILGLRADSADEEIKKYYRKQAVLVHPDKNQEPGAEEAFKILGHAFEMIGEPSKRQQYDSHTQEEMEADAMREFADMLTKLQTKIQEAANIMRCDTCGGKHRRVPVDRPFYSARFCQGCNMHHQAKEGDVWAESSMLGFYWHYYALMEGHVYDITEWMKCHRECFKHMKANVHSVMYRIATEGNKKKNHHPASDANLEELINQLFSKSGMGAARHEAWSAGSATSAAGGAGSAAAQSATGKKSGRRKKRR